MDAQSLLDEVRNAHADMYDGSGSMEQRVDRAILSERRAREAKVPMALIAKAIESGRNDYINRANAMLGTHLKA